jgi:hypothetical protein
MTVGQARRYVFGSSTKRLGNPGAAHYRGKVTRHRHVSREALRLLQRGYVLNDRSPRYWTVTYYWEVVNTKTGAVVASDSGYGSSPDDFTRAMTDCARVVLEVRNAWTQGYLRKRYL